MIIKEVAEGETWVETINGNRLPASVVAKRSSAYPKKDSKFVNAETWRALNPTISCVLWEEEKLWQTQILKAEYRDDLSDMKPVRVRLPVGI